MILNFRLLSSCQDTGKANMIFSKIRECAIVSRIWGLKVLQLACLYFINEFAMIEWRFHIAKLRLQRPIALAIITIRETLSANDNLRHFSIFCKKKFDN